MTSNHLILYNISVRLSLILLKTQGDFIKKLGPETQGGQSLKLNI